jgi:hypothetical protein
MHMLTSISSDCCNVFSVILGSTFRRYLRILIKLLWLQGQGDKREAEELERRAERRRRIEEIRNRVKGAASTAEDPTVRSTLGPFKGHSIEPARPRTHKVVRAAGPKVICEGLA